MRTCATSAPLPLPMATWCLTSTTLTKRVLVRGNGTYSAWPPVWSWSAATREAMDKFSQMTMIDLARFEVRRRTPEGFIRAILGKAERMTPKVTLEKLTCPAKGGLRRFLERPPLLHHISEEEE